MLNGDENGIEYLVEFSNIANIEKLNRGARVELKDGRSFDLRGSNDVNSENRGIVVTSGGESFTVTWDDFRALRLDR